MIQCKLILREEVILHICLSLVSIHSSVISKKHSLIYSGRGAFETMGTGIEMEENEIAFKCNFAVIDDETEIVTKSENYTNSYRRRADRQFEWGIPL